MSMKISYQAAALRICVDEKSGSRIGGRVFSQRLTKPLVFVDIGDLLLQVEDVLDRQDFPAAFQRKRTFVERPKEPCENPGDCPSFMDAETVQAAKGAVATFTIVVIARQNTTWQGRLDWMNGNPPLPFSSALELIRMIDAGLR